MTSCSAASSLIGSMHPLLAAVHSVCRFRDELGATAPAERKHAALGLHRKWPAGLRGQWRPSKLCKYPAGAAARTRWPRRGLSSCEFVYPSISACMPFRTVAALPLAHRTPVTTLFVVCFQIRQSCCWPAMLPRRGMRATVSVCCARCSLVSSRPTPFFASNTFRRRPRDAGFAPRPSKRRHLV